MVQFRKVNRKIKIGLDVATKEGIAKMLNADGSGWTLKGEWYWKTIQVFQAVASEHDDGGPPDVGTPTLEESISIIEAASQLGVSMATVLQATNNGLYLLANAAAKPKAEGSLPDLMAAYWAPANAAYATSAEGMRLWSEACVAKTQHQYLKDWAKSTGR